jgi:3'-phosphoadenosine 5'-phosphosulfate sulfotransferase (PAPS reductase)/FAD synthetase
MAHTYDDTVVLPHLASKAGLSSSNVAGGTLTGTYFSAPEIELDAYDNIVLCMSGGKDSIAALLHLFDQGVDRSKIELWHHDVDGREGSNLMDWPFMVDYNKRLAAAFKLPLYFSWLVDGFEGEMLKKNSISKPHKIETPDGLITLERHANLSKPSTRLKFPQVSANLQTRWCSSALKIDVGRRALNNQSRFLGKRTLFVTGERREESPNRAKYNQFEAHLTDCRNGKKARHVDAYRPVLEWSEDRVWDALQRHNVLPPVPYRLGWGRSSCMKCIFNDAQIWATLRHYFPGSLDKIAKYETSFDTTINRNRINVLDVSKTAKPLQIDDKAALIQAMSHEYTLPIIGTSSSWVMPAGAFNRAGCGPS